MKHRSVRHMMSLFVIIASSLLISSCEAKASADPALARFVVGTWVYEGDYQYRGTTYPDEYRLYTFESGPVVWISTGEDGSRCTYEFVSTDTMRIDCNGAGRELKALRVRREGDYLLIQELDERLSPLGEQLRFTKVGAG